MKVSCPSISSRWFRRLCTSLPVAFLAATLALSPPGTHGQKSAVQKLTVSQIEQLVSHGVPDSTMATQIRRHGLAFKPTPEILKALQAKGAGPLTIEAIQPSPFGTPAESDALESLPIVGGIPGGEPMPPPPPPPPPPVAPSPSRLRVSAGVAEGMLIQKTDPVYPPLARAARISGTVVLQAVISKSGSIDDVHVLSGHPLLVQAALDAAKKWRYRPFLLNGEPLEVQTTVSVVFDLNK